MASSKQKQIKIGCFYAPKTVSSKSIVVPIIDDIVTCVFQKKKVHSNVNQSTIQTWKKSFPRLNVIESDNDVVRLKCLTCTKYKADNIWATDGASNIQKTAIDHCQLPTLCPCVLLRRIPWVIWLEKLSAHE